MRLESLGLGEATRLCLGMSVVVAALALALASSSAQPAAAQDQGEEPDRASEVDGDGVPGDGRPVRLGRATWDTGWFQADILAQLLEELGFTIDGPSTYTNEQFYQGVTEGDIDLWANGWFPLHDSFLRDQTAARPIGTQVAGGALQGYLVDRATAEALDIGSLVDLADPEVAQAFDTNNDGLADLIGCEPTWSCAPIVDDQLEQLGLSNTVTHVKGAYAPLMLDLVRRYDAGDPVLFYTFTPNWTLGRLTPGEDVVWLTVEGAGTPDPVAGLPGCSADPCPTGFAPNDIRFVASNQLLDAEPAILALLDRIQIPLTDIEEQNAALIRGRDSERDIAEQAAAWISENRVEVDTWISDAIQAHLNAGGVLAPRPPRTRDGDGAGIDRLRVVTRLEAPYVTYDSNAYGGFSVELMNLIAEDLGASVEIYAVNSSAKLVDDVERGAADVGIGALPITVDRERRVDFSQPYLDFGLAIAVADSDGGIFGGRLSKVANTFLSLDVLLLIGLLLLLLVAAAHVIWWTERGDDSDFPVDYREGVWEGFWWAAVTATTVGYGDKTPKGKSGRIFGLLWMFSGLFVLAYFTAGVAAAFAVDEITGEINGPADLRGRSVAVPADSFANDFLERQGIASRSFATSETAYDALIAGEVDAIVHDATVLRHLVSIDERGGVRLTGLVFSEFGIGFAVPPESDLQEALNRSLLRLVESGRYGELRDQWLGTDSS